jgi:hypothetical protein
VTRLSPVIVLGLEDRVSRLVHYAHPARAEALLDRIASQQSHTRTCYKLGPWDCWDARDFAKNLLDRGAGILVIGVVLTRIRCSSIRISLPYEFAHTARVVLR